MTAVRVIITLFLAIGCTDTIILAVFEIGEDDANETKEPALPSPLHIDDHEYHDDSDLEDGEDDDDEPEGPGARQGQDDGCMRPEWRR